MTRAMRSVMSLLLLLPSGTLVAQGGDLREKYLTKGPEAASHIDRSIALEDVRKYPEALKEIDAAVALEPDCPMAHLERGHILAKLERFADAAVAYRRAFDLAPDQPMATTVQAALGLGTVLGKLGKAEEAHQWATRALLSDPGNVTGLRGKAWCSIALACRARRWGQSAFLAGVNSLADDPDALPPETVFEWGDRAGFGTAHSLDIPYELPTYPTHGTSVLAPVPVEGDVGFRDRILELVGEPQSGVVAILSRDVEYLRLLDTSGKPVLRKADVTGRVMSVAAAGGRFYLSALYPPRLCIIDPVTGGIERSISIPADTARTVTPFLSEGVVYLSGMDQMVWRVDLASAAVTRAGIWGHVLVDPSERYLLVNVGSRPCPWLKRDALLGRTPDISLSGWLFWEASNLPHPLLKFVHVGGELLLSDARMVCDLWGDRISLSPDGQWVILIGKRGWNPHTDGGPSPGTAVVSIHDLDYLHAFVLAPAGGGAVAINPVTGQAALLQSKALRIFRLNDRPFDSALDVKQAKAVVSLEGGFQSVIAWSPRGDYLVAGKAGGGICVYSNRLSDAEQALSRTWWRRCEPDARVSRRPAPGAAAVGALPELAHFTVQTERDKVAEVLQKALAQGRSVRLPAWKESGTYPLTDELHTLLDASIRSLKEEGEEGIVIYRLREALKKDPSAAWMALYLGEALRRTGQIDEARQAYEVCVRTDLGRTDLTRRALDDLARMLAGAGQGLAAVYCLATSLHADRGGTETIEALRPLLRANGFTNEAARLRVSPEKPVFAGGLPSLAAPAADGPTLPPDRIYAKAAPSVVLIQSRRTSGTGFCVGVRGILLTNDHVTDGQDTVDVYPYTLRVGKPVRTGKLTGNVIARWEEKDMALVRVRGTPSTMVPLDVAVRNPRAGEKVYAVGNPGLGTQILEQSISAGLISSAGRQIEGRTYLQHTAAVNPGNSGGPLLNERGQVVGMVTLKAGLEAISFAIPVEEIRKLFPPRKP